MNPPVLLYVKICSVNNWIYDEDRWEYRFGSDAERLAMFLSDAVTALLTEQCCLVLRKQRSRAILSGKTGILIKAWRTSDQAILIDEGATNRCKQHKLLATEDAFSKHI